MQYTLNRHQVAVTRRVASDDRLDFAEKGIFFYMLFGQDSPIDDWTAEIVALGSIIHEPRAVETALNHLVELGYITALAL